MPNQSLHRPCLLVLAATVIQLTLITIMAPYPAAVRADDEPINTFRFEGCSTENYTQNSTFSHNLNKTLTSLLHSKKNRLYRSASTAAGKNATPSGEVHAMIQCRGDMTSSECDSCASSVIGTDLPAGCPAGKAAMVDADGCYLQYQGSDFVPNYEKIFLQWNANNDTDMIFAEYRDFALSTAIKAAPQNPNFFNATSYANSTGGNPVFALAQCYGYLSASQCSKCLSSVIDFAKNSSSGSRGGKIFLGSCYARFETYEFTVDAISQPPAPAPAPVPVPLSPAPTGFVMQTPTASLTPSASLPPSPAPAAPTTTTTPTAYSPPAPAALTPTSPVNSTSPPSNKSGATDNNKPGHDVIRVMLYCLFALVFL